MKPCFLRVPCYAAVIWPKYLSIWVSVFPILFKSDRRGGSKRAAFLRILWECSWAEDCNPYSVPRQGKSVCWDSALSKHYGFCSREYKNETWERPSTFTFLDTESISWETQIWRKQVFPTFRFMQNSLLAFNLWVTCVHLLHLLSWDALSLLQFLSYTELSHLLIFTTVPCFFG